VDHTVADGLKLDVERHTGALPTANSQTGGFLTGQRPRSRKTPWRFIFCRRHGQQRPEHLRHLIQDNVNPPVWIVPSAKPGWTMKFKTKTNTAPPPPVISATPRLRWWKYWSRWP